MGKRLEGFDAVRYLHGAARLGVRLTARAGVKRRLYQRLKHDSLPERSMTFSMSFCESDLVQQGRWEDTGRTLFFRTGLSITEGKRGARMRSKPIPRLQPTALHLCRSLLAALFRSDSCLECMPWARPPLRWSLSCPREYTPKHEASQA
jgi:hypothetical protein